MTPKAHPPAPKPGTHATYESYDAYASPPRMRTQLVLVTGADEDGTVHGKALGFLDDGAAFAPGQLVPLDGPGPEASK